MPRIQQTSRSISSSAAADVNTIIRKIQILQTGSLQIQENGGAIRIVSPTASSVGGMVITTGQVQILGS